MISGNRVTHVDKAVGTLDAGDRFNLISGVLEEGRVVNVGRFVIPAVLGALRSLKLLPHS